MADILATIKQIAMEAFRASQPMDYLVGTVTCVSPLVIQISQKQPLEGGFLKYTRTAANCKWEVGDKAVLLQKPGAQEFLILDKGGWG